MSSVEFPKCPAAALLKVLRDTQEEKHNKTKRSNVPAFNVWSWRSSHFTNEIETGIKSQIKAKMCEI